MALVAKSLGRRIDWPQIELQPIAAFTAGTANDPAQDIVIASVPNLARSFLPASQGENLAGSQPRNRQVARTIAFISQGSANTVGGATNNFDFRIDVWRAGVLQGCVAYLSMKVNTTTSAVVSAPGTATITATSVVGMANGMQLAVDSGANFEVVTIYNVTGTGFTAYFQKAHSNGVALTSILVPFQPIYFTPANAANVGSNTLIAPGSQAFIPSSIYGLHVGDTIYVSGGAPYETGLAATTVAGTSLTATFTQPHSGTYNVGYYVATTSATAVTGGTTTAIVVGSNANIVVGDTVVLQGTGADSAKTNTMTVLTVAGTTITFTAAISNTYANTINVTNLAYTSGTTTTIANQPSQVISVASTANMSVGGLVALQGLTGNSATAAFTGAPQVCVVQALVANTSITVSPPAVFTNAYAVIPLTATTSSTAVAAAGAATVTLASGTNFATGLSSLYIWGGSGGVAEAVVITAVSSFTATATFAQAHSGAYTVQSGSAPLTGNAAPFNYVPSNVPFEFREDDVISITRISNSATGLASPAGVVNVEWVPSGVNG